MSAPYSPKQRDEAASWLKRADEDINAARVLLALAGQLAAQHRPKSEQ